MTTNDPGLPDKQRLAEERYELLHRLEDLLETPLIALGFVWLALVAVELVYGESTLFGTLGVLIWIVFLVDFAVKFWIAPKKVPFLQGNWLTAISLVLPALRVFRISVSCESSGWPRRAGDCVWYRLSAR